MEDPKPDPALNLSAAERDTERFSDLISRKTLHVGRYHKGLTVL